MNKKIQSQVYNEINKKRKLAYRVFRGYDPTEMKKAISRTIELMEDKSFTEKIILEATIKEEQKADFRKELEDLKIRCASFQSAGAIVTEVDKILAKLGDDYSPPQDEDKLAWSNSKDTDTPEDKISKVVKSSGTSKGCGKKKIGGEGPIYYYFICGEGGFLCKSCKKKTSTCICGHDLKNHYGFINDKKKGGKCNKCKCKKFQEVGG